MKNLVNEFAQILKDYYPEDVPDLILESILTMTDSRGNDIFEVYEGLDEDGRILKKDGTVFTVVTETGKVVEVETYIEPEDTSGFDSPSNFYGVF